MLSQHELRKEVKESRLYFFFLFRLQSDIFLNPPELGCLCSAEHSDTKLLMKSSHGRRDQ